MAKATLQANIEIDSNRMKIDKNSMVIIGHLTKGCIGSNWLSQVSIAGLVGAGLVFAIKDWKFKNLLFNGSDSSMESELYVPGLQNLGNSCFLNVILQALASCEKFQPFLQRALEEYESSAVVEPDGNLPLTTALASLLEDLCSTSKDRVVLSPHKVMQAVTLYIQNFNLMSQQDAAEAFLHLLSSIREEFSDSYLPIRSTLADISTCPNRRFLNPNKKEGQSEQERWQKYFLGPFDGILGSTLACQTCSSQISLDFQHFHSLPLPPMRKRGSTSMIEHNLEDCMKQFFNAERIENYLCSSCWHIAATKYSSLRGEDEVIKKLKKCGGRDSCDCRRTLNLETLPWSNRFSCTIKQLSIARCPEILCVHLQRVSINAFGEPTKLQGHINFPLFLDLSPYMMRGLGIKNLDEMAQMKLPSQNPNVNLDTANMHYDAGILNYLCKPVEESICSETASVSEFGNTAHAGETNSNKGGGCIGGGTNSDDQAGKKVSTCLLSQTLVSNLYRLVSVVEHFGGAGGGHYTVYRSIKTTESHQDDSHMADSLRWFCVSDNNVSNVPETDVLAAEASLLFYERCSKD